MSKKKVKELLFDLNTNELVEVDENGEKIPNKDNKVDETDNKTIKEDADEIKDKDLEELFKEAPEEEIEEKNPALLKYEEIREKLAPKAEEIKIKAGDIKVKAKENLNLAKEKTLDFWKNAKSYFKNVKEDKNSIFNQIINIFKKDKRATYIVIGVLIVGIVGYGVYYVLSPDLDSAQTSYEDMLSPRFNSEIHPIELFSTSLENLVDFKGEPISQGDGSSQEARYVVYKMDWFGQTRDTAVYYDTSTNVESLRIKIGDVPAQDLYNQYFEMFGKPKEEMEPTKKGGYAIFIKDGVQVKIIHNGEYMSVDMRLAKYDNVNNLLVGENPIVVQNIFDYDINQDGENDKILLIGNKNPASTLYDKLYLLVWDGNKTHLFKMAEELDGGSYPQLLLVDADTDKIKEIVITAGNNEIIRNYNVFKYEDGNITNIYSGHNEKFE